MTNLFLNSKTVKLDIYTDCKYFAEPAVFENCTTVEYDGCTGFEVVTGAAARAIEAESDGSCIDDFHKYLVLFFEDGSTSTFRNSYVDMFTF